MTTAAEIHTASPEKAIEALIARHDAALQALRQALTRYFADGSTPAEAEKVQFCYPYLAIDMLSPAASLAKTRAFARLEGQNTYATTITQPRVFAPYLLEQLRPLCEDFKLRLRVGISTQRMPYPYVLDSGDELTQGLVDIGAISRHFAGPNLSEVGDEIVDGLYLEQLKEGDPLPLSHFDALRTDYSLRRLVHYTGTDWRHMQPWILLTNYQRYVDQFTRWAMEQLRTGQLAQYILPGNVVLDAALSETEMLAAAATSPASRFQMPAYHAIDNDGRGITLVNIGVGPPNAKTITDHLAVLRPHCWLMVGHCGGLRASQTIGDYVLAHAYLRRDHILDRLVPPEIPIPALAEVQVALQMAAAHVTGDSGEALKRRLRTGTVVTYDDRNWELRWKHERQIINLSRAIAADMESGTVAAQGYRMRVPYGTLLCVSDKPLHGEIKLPGAASAFYARAVGEHLMIGIEALRRLRDNQDNLHSRKLRAFNEVPFR